MSARKKEPTERGTAPGPGGTADEDVTQMQRPAAKRPDSGPIQVISMRSPAPPEAPVAQPVDKPSTPLIKRPKLRAMSDVAPGTQPQQHLGYLAPPRDPDQARTKRMHDLVVWGSVSVIVASAVALVIWFLAR